MTPAAIYTAVRDFLIAAVIGFIAWRIYTDGKNAVTVTQFKQFEKQMAQQAETSAQWHTEATDANTTLAASLGRINTAPVVVHDWVRQQSSCPDSKVLPAAAPAAGSSDSQGGGSEPGVGTTPDGSRRDAVFADFKQRREAELAACRVLWDAWPKP